MNNTTALDRQIKLYGVIVDQLHRCTSILWQAPIVLVAANVLALDRLYERPWAVLALGLFDAAFIFGLHKIVLRQRSLVVARRRAENMLGDEGLADFVPKFEASRLSAPRVMLIALWLLDGDLLGWAAFHIFRG